MRPRSRRPRPRPGPHPARHGHGQRGHRPAAALPPAGQLRHPVQPQPAGAADRPHRPVRPDAEVEVSTSSAPAGRPAARAPTRPTWSSSPGSPQGGQERADLGRVNPVLANAVEARMLGRPVLIDPLQVTPNTSTSLLRAERDLREQVRALHDQLDSSVRQLHVSPANIRRVVDTALEVR